ncbi:glycosyltransferase family 2 protein [Aureimonas pseudogalii]|uniref:GT2 family glycosyltransferase n=1 Tax=Aureimonas pseudogalii TaxID=1744844 RepID=A0A7W6H6R5_9HYPH|nr:glycosyltransferase [Aureimonas pseudogalii]MBB3999588.1 GT2 family glycosyltransferase [Aureimonas pseudogalii]
MYPVPLTLRPLADRNEGRREGDVTLYDTRFEDLDFVLEGFPNEPSYGLHRLSIEMPLSEAAVSARLRAEFGDEQRRIRVTVQPRRSGIDFFFVLLGDERRPVLTLSVAGVPQIALGPAMLQRASTTLWRARRLRSWLGQRTRRPMRLGEDLRSLRSDLRHRGWAELRRRAVEAMNPSVWSERREMEEGVDRVLRRTSIVNREIIARLCAAATGRPASLTIVVPVFRTPLDWLAQLVESLANQTDAGFEAIFVLDGPQEEQAWALGEATQAMPQARILALPENVGAAAATNAGIRAATGDFVLVVDHDDRLERHLVEAFHAASAAEDADIVFADEAITDAEMRVVRQIETRGRFDLRYYLSHPYIVHPIFVRRSLALGVGGLDERLKVSHDVEFFLRCVGEARVVVQIPLLLYFWRTHEASLGHAARDDVYRNTSEAVRAFLARRTPWPAFEVGPGVNFNELEIRPPLPPGARVALVIPTKNGHEILRQCLASIEARASANRTPADIFVIDHQSDDPATLRFLSEAQAAGRISVVPHVGPWNYSAINNAAIRDHVSGRGYSHVVLMNNDIELITEDWLDRMIEPFSWGDVGVTGCCLLYPDRRIQHAGVVVGLTGPADHVSRFEESVGPQGGPRLPGPMSSLVVTRDFSAVTAALMAVSLPAFEAVGGFDETLAIGFNDTDLCLRIGEQGLASTYVGGVVAFHHESLTRKASGGVEHPGDTARFLDRYAAMIREGDPHYGAGMDWSQTAVRYAERPQKRFGLRVAHLR